MILELAHFFAIEVNGFLTSYSYENSHIAQLSDDKLILSPNLIYTASHLAEGDHTLIAFGTAFGHLKVCQYDLIDGKLLEPMEVGQRKGAVFSIELLLFSENDKRLVAACEDRSISIYRLLANQSSWEPFLNLNSEVFSARIWCVRACPLFGIAAVGEDCKLVYWPDWTEPTKMRVFDTLHHGRNCWSLDFQSSGQSHHIVTGGNDGGVKSIKLTFKSSLTTSGSVKCIDLSPNAENAADFPRHILLITADACIVAMDSGKLFALHLGGSRVQLGSLPFRHYSVSALSNRKLVFGGLEGKLVFFDLNSDGQSTTLHQIQHLSLQSSKIMHLHWLKQDHMLLVSLHESQIAILRRADDHLYQPFCRLQMPTNAWPEENYWTNCATENEEDGLLLVGTRNGTLLLYSLNRLAEGETIGPEWVGAKSHRKEGCASVNWHAEGAVFLSLGRSTPAELRSWAIARGSDGIALQAQDLIRNPAGCTHISRLELHPQRLLLGFRSNFFAVIQDSASLSFAQENLLFLQECGGSKRSWDFHPLGPTFAWINKRTVNFSSSPFRVLGHRLAKISQNPISDLDNHSVAIQEIF
ncbi:hypothetical protein Ciccas_008682, partial [Cichlidogyrus casuarinus]